MYTTKCIHCDKEIETTGNEYTTCKNCGAKYSATQLRELKFFKVENKKLIRYTGVSKEVIIPDGITHIGDNAFSAVIDDGYSEVGLAVEKVVIPDSVIDIGWQAFCNCDKLKDIRWGKNIKRIWNDAFSNTAITALNLPPITEFIECGTFSHCKKLTQVTLPYGLEYVSENMFSFCPIQEITLPTSIRTIENGAFWNTDLEEIIIPDSVVEIGMNAFNGCKKLKRIVLGENVRVIGEHAFSEAPITEITIPSSVAKIGDLAFAGCENLTNVAYLCDPSIIDEEKVFYKTPYIKFEKNLQAQFKEQIELKKAKEKDLEHLEKIRAQRQKEAEYRRNQRCQHCGGAFKGLLFKKCSNCGIKKDY